MNDDRQDERRTERRAATERRPATGSRVNGYLLSWIALAAFAFGYIGVAATRPDLLPGVMAISDLGAEQLAGGRSAGDLADEIASLRKWVNDLQHEMVAAKGALQHSEHQQQALAQRMAAAEDRLPAVREIRAEAAPVPAAGHKVRADSRGAAKVAAPVSAQLDAQDTAANPQMVAVAVAAQPTETRQSETAPAETVSLGTNGLKVINGGTTSSIVTSSIAPSVAAPVAAAAPFAAAKVVPSVALDGTRGIEIADAESLEGLRTRWVALADRNPAVLKRLQPRYRISSAGNSETPFTLLAGPFANTAEAARSCAQLRAAGVTCRIGEYTGNGL